MKVSINTVKQYTDIDLSVDELVQKINQQLGGVESVVDGYQATEPVFHPALGAVSGS